MKDAPIQVLTTTDRKEDAERIARALVDRRLAGCVQILGPVVSTYRWQGKVERAEEWLCFVKTRQDLYGAVEEAIKANHLHPKLLHYLACMGEEHDDCEGLPILPMIDD